MRAAGRAPREEPARTRPRAAAARRSPTAPRGRRRRSGPKAGSIRPRGRARRDRASPPRARRPARGSPATGQSSAEPRSSAAPARSRSGRGSRGAPRAPSESRPSRRRARRARSRPARGSGPRRRGAAARPSSARRPARPRAARSRNGARGARTRASPARRTGSPAGGRSRRDRLKRSGLERGLGLRRALADGARIAHRAAGGAPAVERDLGLAQARDELVVGEPLAPRGRVDTHDPEAPEGALLVLAVAVGVDQRVVDLLLGALVAGVLEAPVAARLLEHLAALLARVNGSLDSRPGLPPQQLLDLAHVRVRDRLVAPEGTLALRRFLLEQVGLRRFPPQELARSRHLEPLLRCAVCLLLWHLLSSLRHSSSGPASSPCCDRPGEAGTLSARSPS